MKIFIKHSRILNSPPQQLITANTTKFNFIPEQFRICLQIIGHTRKMVKNETGEYCGVSKLGFYFVFYLLLTLN
jgi:hypothetical protein